MNIIIILIGLLCILSFIYVGYLHNELYKKGIIKTTKRLSLKFLNKIPLENIQDSQLIFRSIKFYKWYLVFFYVEILLIAIKLFVSIDTK